MSNSENNNLFGSASSAVISDCGTYRYRLTRTWDESAPKVVWIMLNPSTADAETDDPTIRRCIGFSRDLGFGGLIVVNLFALRATNPMDLWGHHDPVGKENSEYILAAIAEVDRIGGRWQKSTIVAWGKHAKAFGVGNNPTQDTMIIALLKEAGVTPYCLGTNKDGTPRHPLYLAANTDLIPFALEVAS